MDRFGQVCSFKIVVDRFGQVCSFKIVVDRFVKFVLLR